MNQHPLFDSEDNSELFKDNISSNKDLFEKLPTNRALISKVQTKKIIDKSQINDPLIDNSKKEELFKSILNKTNIIEINPNNHNKENITTTSEMRDPLNLSKDDLFAEKIKAVSGSDLFSDEENLFTDSSLKKNTEILPKQGNKVITMKNK